jgi:tryptophan halogenase
MKHIVIAGTGFSGWYTALGLLNNLKDISITIIGSSKIPKLAVGESLAWGTPMSFKYLLGLQIEDQRKFMRETGSIYKYGIQFDRFLSDTDQSFVTKTHNLKIKSLVKFFSNFDKKDFYNSSTRDPGDYSTLDAWLYTHKQSFKSFSDFQTSLNDAYFFAKEPLAPFDTNNKLIVQDQLGVSYHIDANRSANLLRKTAFSQHPNIHEIDSTIARVTTDSNNITGIVLDNGTTVTGDIYIDVTGFKRVLTKSINNKSWLDKSVYSADTAVVLPKRYTDPYKQMISATKFMGHDYGWGFGINLYHRTGNGYVFKRDLVNKDQILRDLQLRFGNDIKPFTLEWEPGYYTKPWTGNTVAVGIASGFIDPFDGNVVTTQNRAIRAVIDTLNKNLKPDEYASYYNKMYLPAIEEINTKLTMSFVYSQRSGPFWDLQREQKDKFHYLEKLKDMVSHRSKEFETNPLLSHDWFQQYTRIIAQAGIDISDFDISPPSTEELELFNAYCVFNKERNRYIAQMKWPNNYEWHRDNIYSGKTSDEVWEDFNN